MRNKFLLQFATGSVSKMQQALSQLTARTTNCDNMLLHFAIGALLQKARALSQFTHVLQSVPKFALVGALLKNATSVVTIFDW